jgi:hypothetical protein
VSTDLSHTEIEELLGAYALNAVEEPERSQVEQHLEECPRCRAEVADHRETAALLASSGAPAPEGLWSKIADSLEEAPPPMRLDLPAPAPDRDGSVVPFDRPARARSQVILGRRALGLMAAAAVLVVALLGGQVVRQERLLDDLRTTVNEDAMLRAANLALADPDSSRARLESPDGELTVTAVLSPNGTGYLLTQALPGLDPSQTYQLWGISGDTVLSLGVLGSDPDEVVPFRAGGPVEVLAITEELVPGVVSSANEPRLVGALS